MLTSLEIIYSNYSVVLESMGNPELDDYLQNKIDNRLYNYSHDMCLMSMCDYHVIANSTFMVSGQ